MIKEPTPNQSRSPRMLLSQNVMERDIEESGKAPPTTRERMESAKGMEILSVSAASIPDDKLVIHKNPLYKTMNSFNKDVSLPRWSSTTMLNNYQYNLKLMRLVIPVPNR